MSSTTKQEIIMPDINPNPPTTGGTFADRAQALRDSGRALDKWDREILVAVHDVPIGPSGQDAGRPQVATEGAGLPHIRGDLRKVERAPDLASKAAKQAIRNVGLHNTLASHLMAGLGPRTAAQLLADVEVLDEEAEKFRTVLEMGAELDIRSFVVESQSHEFNARGNSSGPNQSGTVNTPAEDYLSYRPRLERFMLANRPELTAKYDKENPIGAQLLKQALTSAEAPGFGDKKVTAGRAMLVRADWGKENWLHLNKQLAEAQKKYPFYRVEVLNNATVTHIALSAPGGIKTTITNNRGEELGVVDAAVVRANTGTTLSRPEDMIPDPEVLKLCHVGAMNLATVSAHLDSLKLTEEIDGERRLRPDAVVVVGGTSLSASDTQIALQNRMALFDHTGHVSEQAKSTYGKGTLIFASRSASFPYPRHATADNPINWAQKTAAFYTSEELHAAFLHNSGEMLYVELLPLERANVGRAIGMTAAQVDADNKMEGMERLKRQQTRNDFHLQKLEEAKGLEGDALQAKVEESTHTLEGAYRQASFATVLGVAPAPDVVAEFDRMKAKFPHTHRGGYPSLRAQFLGITATKEGQTQENSEWVKAFNARMAHVTSSPPQVQRLWLELFESGIARHVKADHTKDLEVVKGEDKPLVLTANDGTRIPVDTALISLTFSLERDVALRSTAGQVRPIHEALPYMAELGLNRQTFLKDGTLVPLENYSLQGKGKNPPGSRNTASGPAWDTNNRESGTEVAKGLSYRRFAMEMAVAAGVADPVAHINAKYAKFLPTEDQYKAEVAQAASHFQTFVVKSAYARMVEAVAPEDFKVYSALMDLVRQTSDPEELVTRFTETCRSFEAPVALGDAALRDRAVLKFRNDVRNTASFNPPERDTYFKRFVDAPLAHQTAIFEEAYAEAKQALSARRPAPATAAT
jgi:hypothetical protein